MERPKNKPARKDGYFEYKRVVGQGINGPIRKSFYSKISKKDAEKKYQEYLVNLKTAEVTGVGFVETGTGFTEWGRMLAGKLQKAQGQRKYLPLELQKHLRKALVSLFQKCRFARDSAGAHSKVF